MSTQIDLADLAERVTIPTLPDVVTRLIAIVEDPHADIEDIAELIARDAPITTRVLRIANSAVYGLAHPAASALDAARVVGARTLKNIALQTSIVAHYDSLAGVEELDVDSLWHHSVLTGQLAQELAIRTNAIRGIPPDEFYTCGLLHDIGKVVLLETLGEEYLGVYRQARSAKRAVHVVEQQVFGFDHADVGSVVATRWGLHEHIAQVIHCHHGPRVEIEDDTRVTVVAVADQVAYRIDTKGFEAARPKLAALAHRLLGLTGEEFDDYVAWAYEVLPLVEVG